MSSTPTPPAGIRGAIDLSALTAGPTVRSRATVTLPKVATAGRRLVVKVQVAVAGTRFPPGAVRVVLARPHWKRTVTLALFRPGHGLRVAFFPKVPKGRYTVTITYPGSPRVLPTRVQRTLRVR